MHAEADLSIGASLVLIAIGAILKFAVTKQISGINLSTVGVVLMVVAIIGLVIALVMMSVLRPTDVVHDRGGATVTEPPAGTNPHY